MSGCLFQDGGWICYLLILGVLIVAVQIDDCAPLEGHTVTVSFQSSGLG